MSFPVRAITLDLDDTLWPFPPIGARIERVLDEWLRERSPQTAERFPIHAMRALRERVFAENPQLIHDLSTLRRLTIETALRKSGGDVALADEGYAVFYAARNQVDFYPDALEGLRRIAARMPVVALSNGNADLNVIGLAPLFHSQLHSREHGAAKPEASIFLAACEQLGVAPGEVLHVGDHPELDALGAMRAGLRACWLDRGDHAWPEGETRADLEFHTLTELADWLEARNGMTTEIVSAL